LQGIGKEGVPILEIALLFISLPAVCAFAWFGQKWVLLPLFRRFDRIQEYVFLLSIGWCLGIAQLSATLGLSYEIGAFIAGITIATSPLAVFIAESLKPLRDFFLVMFFFGLGANFDISAAPEVLLPAVILGIGLLLFKPVVFRYALVGQAESNKLAWETGIRLGQLSEFSLLIVFVAVSHQLISDQAATLIQIATIISFIFSAWYIVLKFPTPIALNDKLRRD